MRSVPNFVFVFLASSQHLPPVAIISPGNGSLIVGSETKVLVAVPVNEGSRSKENVICIELDNGHESCAPAAVFEAEPVTIKALLPGERTLCAWLKATTSQAHSQRSCNKFKVSRNADDPNPLDVSQITSHTQVCSADNPDCSTTLSRKEYFDFIYRSEVWKQSPNTLVTAVRSGHGSTYQFTANIREVLMGVLEIPRMFGSVQRLHGVTEDLQPQGDLEGGTGANRDSLLLKYGISSMLDLPCGDMSWMPAQFFQSKGIRYTGADISEVIIHENQQQERFAGLEFLVLDAVEQEIPHGKFDLIFCRHMMYHLSPADNVKLLQAFDRSGAKYVMLTTYMRADENEADFVLAFGHKVNLFRPPYCLRDPVQLFLDGEVDGYMGLWELHPTVPLMLPATECMGAERHRKAKGAKQKYHGMG
jgi:hypothetical protein